MTINPLTGEYTHTDLTTLRTRFESLLESGPVFMTWRHLQTPDGTHLDTATTEHPHLAACFQAATQLANGESIYSIQGTPLTTATHTHPTPAGHPCTHTLTSIHHTIPTDQIAAALAEIQKDPALHTVVSDWLRTIFTPEHPLVWSTSAAALILAGLTRPSPDQTPLTARTHWVQQWCEQYIMTSAWETGQASTLRHLQATNLNAYTAARTHHKAHINRFTQEETRQLR